MAFGDSSALAGFMTAVFAVAITIPAAEFLYRAVERPCIDFAGRRLQGARG
jgi:peptidoglycan/LPS O-acetylase OafA/YrhL